MKIDKMNNSKLEKNGLKSGLKIDKVTSQKGKQLFGSGDWNNFDEPTKQIYDKNSEVYLMKINGHYLIQKIIAVKDFSSHQKISQMRNLMQNQRQIMLKLIQNQNKDQNKYLIECYRVDYSQKDQLIIYMEYFPKGTLKDYLQSKEYKKFKQSNCLQCEKRNSFIMVQIMLAVFQLHQLKFVHRDLKPANLFIDQELNIKLGDFGSACPIIKEDYQSIIGTFGYVCPQMVFGNPNMSIIFSRIHQQAQILQESDYMKIDMWSMGVIFYELFHKDGKLPYQFNQLGKKYNQQFVKVYKLIFKTQYEQILNHYEATNQIWFKQMIEKMLVKDQHQRPSWSQIYSQYLPNILLFTSRLDFLAKNKIQDITSMLLKAKPFYQAQNYKKLQIIEKENEFSQLYELTYIKSKKNVIRLLKEKPKQISLTQKLNYLQTYYGYLQKLIEINDRLQQDKNQIGLIFKQLYNLKYVYSANSGKDIDQVHSSPLLLNKSQQKINNFFKK